MDLRNTKKQNGFSLIELLVVIAIIGILATIGSISYSSYINTAKKGVASANYQNTIQFVKIVGQLISSGLDKTGGLGDNELTDSYDIAIAISTKMHNEISNPYTNTPAIQSIDTLLSCDKTNRGVISLKESEDNLVISSCFSATGNVNSKTILIK
jgi:type IV pilus assembly protein PilA